MIQAPLQLQPHNPDVLMCIANLSNDEVFTPPELVNQMLDTLQASWADAHSGANLWENKEVTFLDPCTKSGVFLREIVKRLTVGLNKEIPDLTERVNHILTKQVYGVAITELTSLLARRSLYCSKFANGLHSVARVFKTEEGNVWFERTEHSWEGGKCKFCGASKAEYARSPDLETHAYKFIHTKDVRAEINKLFGGHMRFDVVIGNPPYQLSDGGHNNSAVPIYQKFVQQAIKLEPRFLSMVIPSRWFSGGRGLDEFREQMLDDSRIRTIHDFPDSSDVFPGTQIKGGVCFFLWNRDNRGLVNVVTHDRGNIVSADERPLREPGSDVFIRYNKGVQILRRVKKIETEVHREVETAKTIGYPTFSSLVSSLRPFGLRTYFQGKTSQGRNDYKIYQNGGVAFVKKDEITSGHDLIAHWKVFIPRAGSGSDSFPHPILGRPFVGEPESVCTETYLCIGPLKSKKQAENVCSYLSTRFVRFLVLLHKPSQDATRSVYSFVPIQDFSKPWSDEELYRRYKITADEIAFIESLVRPGWDADE
jgi:hypothetical protein